MRFSVQKPSSYNALDDDNASAYFETRPAQKRLKTLIKVPCGKVVSESSRISFWLWEKKVHSIDQRESGEKQEKIRGNFM